MGNEQFSWIRDLTSLSNREVSYLDLEVDASACVGGGDEALEVYGRSATVTSRGNRSWRFHREQVRAYRVQLCILLVRQSAGAKCASVMYLQRKSGEDWNGQSSMLITLGRDGKLAISERVNKKDGSTLTRNGWIC